MLDYHSYHEGLLVALILAGLAGLTFGGDWLAKGAASLAILLKVNPVVIGLTVVSIATSMPELFTGFKAAVIDKADLALGNIIGSNLGNIGLIMGITALIYPIRIQKRLIMKEVPILLAATLVFSAVCFNERIGRIDGSLLVLGLIGYLAYLITSARQEEDLIKEEVLEEIPEPVRSVTLCFGFVVLGSVTLGLGAEVLVGSAEVIAKRMNISDALIGITLVAIGTSLPELGASVAAARRRQSSICAGNIVGSNLFNMLFVGGGVSMAIPLKVDKSLFQVEFPAMLLLTALLWLIFTTDRKVTRMEGAILLAIYGLIIALSYMSQTNRFSGF